MPSSAGARPVVVFDLGGVLIDWNPRHLYRRLLDDEREIERFLAEVCHAEWNEEQDRGRTFAEAIEEAVARHPGERALIEAYHHRWHEMLAGPIAGSVQILEELKKTGFELHALTNWSVEKFPIARERYDFLDWFESIGRSAADCVYIDDNAKNVAAAEALGFDAIHFQGPGPLRLDLVRRGALSGQA